MLGRVHALLIGIDAYRERPLYGCVNDVNAVEAWLLDAGVERAFLRKLIAPHKRAVPVDEQPTLGNLRAALSDLATARVEHGERVFIYYSGHGVRHLGDLPNGRRFAREALVPSDAWRDDGSMQLLFDTELNQILSTISTRGAYLTCVFDCCHSGGVTRGPSRDGVAGGSDRGFELGNIEVDNAPPAATGLAATTDGWSVVMACEASETSRESDLGPQGARRGVFTHAFLEAARKLPAGTAARARWSDVWRSLVDTVATHNPYQHPRPLGAWSRPILGGPASDGDRGIPIRAVADGEYEIAAGASSGLAAGSRLAVYGATPNYFQVLNSAEDLADRLGTVEVTQLLEGYACARASSGAPFALPDLARSRLLSVAAPLRLALKAGDSLARDALRDLPLVQACAPDAGPEAWLEVVSDSERMLGDELYNSRDEAAPRGLIRLRRATAPRVRALLEHYCRYSEPVRMARRCRDLPGSLTIDVLDCGDVAPSNPFAGNLQQPDLAVVAMTAEGFIELRAGQRFCLRVGNGASRELSVGLFCCTIDGRVEFLRQQLVPASGQAIWWAGEELGTPWEASLAAGRSAAYERLVAIGTTVAGYSFDHLELSRSFADALDAEDARVRRAALVRGAQDRLVAPAQPPPPPERWTGIMREILVRRSS
jgi:hypothetical protein